MTRPAPQPPADPVPTRTAYGLRVISDVDLPELAPDSALPATAPLLRIRRGPVDRLPGGETQGFHFAPDRTVFRWDAVGGFAVSQDGLTITCDPAPGVTEDLLAFPLLGPVLFDALRRQGLFVLHASAVTLGGQAVVLMADKGTGKSTSAAALVRAGGRLLADDLVAVTADGRVLPGFGQIKLASDAADHQLPAGSTLRGHVHTAIDKHRVLLPQCMADAAPRPLARLLVLHRGNGAGGVQALPDGAALPAVLRFAYAARFGAGLLNGAAADAHFRHAVRLAGTVPVRALTLPGGLTAMDGLAELVRRDLAGGPPG